MFLRYTTKPKYDLHFTADDHRPDTSIFFMDGARKKNSRTTI